MTDLMSRPQQQYSDDDPYAGADRYHQMPPPPAPPTAVLPPSGGRRWPRRVAGGAAILALVAGGGTAGGMFADRYLIDHPAATRTTASNSTATVTEGDDLAAIVKSVEPSIVTVTVDGARSTSLGSGVVLRPDGLILTNNHVIAENGTVSVRLSTGRTVPAKVVATDTKND